MNFSLKLFTNLFNKVFESIEYIPSTCLRSRDLMVNKIDIRQITVKKLHGAYSLKIKRQQHLYDRDLDWREQVLQALGKGHLGREQSERAS